MSRRNLLQIALGFRSEKEKPLHVLGFLGPTPLLDHLSEFVEDLIAVEQFVAIGFDRTSLQLCLELLKSILSLPLLAFEKAERLPNNLACGLVAAGFDSTFEEGVEFRCDRNVD